MTRIGILLGVALPLAALDLAVKASVPTEPWAYHARSLGWLSLSLSLLAVLVLLSRIPSVLVALASGILAAGLLGNSLSAASNGMEVPNPLVAGGGRGIVAFNLADVFVLLGVFLLVVMMGIWLVRNRTLLPPPAEVRETRGRALRRLFD